MNLKAMPVVAAAIAVLLLVAGCGGGNGGDGVGSGGGGAPAPAPAPAVPPTATLDGVAAKGLLLNAPVRIHPVNNGVVGTAPLAMTRTSATTGEFSVTVTHAGPVVVRITVDGNTTMLDELAGTPVPAPSGLALHAALPAITGLQTLAVTPLTELAYALAGAAAGGLTASNIEAANEVVGDTFLGGASALFTRPIVLAAYGQATDAQQAQAKVLTALAVAAEQGTAVGEAGQPCNTGSYGDRLTCLVGGIERLVSVDQNGNVTLAAAAGYLADAYASIDQGAVTVNGGQSPASLGLATPTSAQTAFSCALLGNCNNGVPPVEPPPPPPPPPPGPATPRVANFVYAALAAANQIAIYSADPASGALAPAGTTATGAGTQPSAVVADPARRYLYVANAGNGTIARYRIDAATGALTAAGSTPAAAAPVHLTVDPLGRFLFALHGNEAQASVSNFLIDPADGGLTAVDAPSSLPFGGPLGLTMDKTGRTLFVSYKQGLRQIPINQSTGAFGSTNTQNNIVNGVAITGFNGRLYTAEQTTFGLMSWSFDPASATALGGPAAATMRHYNSPAAPIVQWKILEADPQGRFLFAYNGTHGLVEAYRIDAATGGVALAQASLAELPAGTWTPPAGCNPQLLQADATGRTLRTACGDGTGRIFSIAVNRLTGALGGAGNVTAAADATGLATVTLGARLVLSAQADGIGIHTVDPATGAMPEVAAKLPLDSAPVALTAEADGRRLYALRADGKLMTLAIDPATGALTDSGGSIQGAGVAAPVIDPAGRHAYVPNGNGLSISRHAIGGAGLGAGVEFAVDSAAHPNHIALDPRGIVFHPSGRYAYVSHGGSGSGPGVTVFEVDAATGAPAFHSLTAFPNFFGAAGELPTGLAIDPTGSFLYVASGSTVQAYRINPANGLLLATTQKIDGGLTLGSPVTGLVADPLGRHLYAATGSGVRVLAIDRSPGSADRGAVTPVGPAVAGAMSQLWIEPAGQRLYGAAATASPALSSFAIDRSAATPAIGAAATTGTDAPVAALAISP